MRNQHGYARSLNGGPPSALARGATAAAVRQQRGVGRPSKSARFGPSSLPDQGPFHRLHLLARFRGRDPPRPSRSPDRPPFRPRKPAHQESRLPGSPTPTFQKAWPLALNGARRWDVVGVQYPR